ncbi:hypothetical protein [Sharpea azabuensis]|uniref:hypothetical protein n=1 Tax=Sharpea azabuensis TaxID=322505 RepID=UPI002E819EB6|nr:hypothetical protein [Sharpea azabuensis]MEE3309561.1 hypothetical protein [Sharpea azabuensis]
MREFKLSAPHWIDYGRDENHMYHAECSSCSEMIQAYTLPTECPKCHGKVTFKVTVGRGENK